MAFNSIFSLYLDGHKICSNFFRLWILLSCCSGYSSRDRMKAPNDGLGIYTAHRGLRTACVAGCVWRCLPLRDTYSEHASTRSGHSRRRRCCCCSRVRWVCLCVVESSWCFAGRWWEGGEHIACAVIRRYRIYRLIVLYMRVLCVVDSGYRFSCL